MEGWHCSKATNKIDFWQLGFCKSRVRSIYLSPTFSPAWIILCCGLFGWHNSVHTVHTVYWSITYKLCPKFKIYLQYHPIKQNKMISSPLSHLCLYVGTDVLLPYVEKDMDHIFGPRRYSIYTQEIDSRWKIQRTPVQSVLTKNPQYHLKAQSIILALKF